MRHLFGLVFFANTNLKDNDFFQDRWDDVTCANSGTDGVLALTYCHGEDPKKLDFIARLTRKADQTLRQIFCQLPEFKFLDFAGRRFGQLPKYDLLWCLEPGQPLPDKSDDLRFICGGAVL